MGRHPGSAVPPVSGDLYRVEGASPTHPIVDVVVHQRDEAGAVKARLDRAMTAQCGHRHWVSARRVNRRDAVLDWRVTAYCFPEGYAPASKKQMADECDGIDGMLAPVDRAAVEAAHQARLDWAASMAGDVVLRSRGLVS